MTGEQVNLEMVERLIVEGALWSPRLIAAFRSTPRHRFLDRYYHFSRKHSDWREVVTREPSADELRVLYSDRALITHLSRDAVTGVNMPISSSSQPSLMARMLEDLKLDQGQKVLEIGAGTGYNAALLAAVVGAGQVHSADVDRNVLSEAWEHLRAFPERHIKLHHADGRQGLAGEAPFDRIMVTAATPDLEPAWLGQLAPGGSVMAPLALAPGLSFIVRGQAEDGVFRGRLLRPAFFMALRGEQETGPADFDRCEPVGSLQAFPAPWKSSFERRRATASWLGFSQALGFYGWLQGLGIHYRSLPNGSPSFGMRDRHSGNVCWFAADEWEATGEPGRQLGTKLWEDFREAGCPWPTEFDLTASPRGGLAKRSPDGVERQGPVCQQIWELGESRERPACFT